MIHLPLPPFTEPVRAANPWCIFLACNHNSAAWKASVGQVVLVIIFFFFKKGWGDIMLEKFDMAKSETEKWFHNPFPLCVCSLS